jgi:hypothetical protein
MKVIGASARSVSLWLSTKQISSIHRACGPARFAPVLCSGMKVWCPCSIVDMSGGHFLVVRAEPRRGSSA